MRKMWQKLFLAIAALTFVQVIHAMCAATTRNLVQLEIVTCQQIRIHASEAEPPAHAIHKRGSSITGTLVTGRVIDSRLVWDGDPGTAEYLVESPKQAVGAIGSFFLRRDASRICPDLPGSVETFVTDPPCCDLLPADGICLVPTTLTIARVEKKPQRWAVWEPGN